MKIYENPLKIRKNPSKSIKVYENPWQNLKSQITAENSNSNIPFPQFQLKNNVNLQQKIWKMENWKNRTNSKQKKNLVFNEEE